MTKPRFINEQAGWYAMPAIHQRNYANVYIYETVRLVDCSIYFERKSHSYYKSAFHVSRDANGRDTNSKKEILLNINARGSLENKIKSD